MTSRKQIEGACLTWKTVLAFLDTLPPWQDLRRQVDERCADADERTYRLMTASVGVCIHNYSFPENLHRVLRMIGENAPQPFRWHGHVSPERWCQINTVIVAVQGWISETSAVTLSRQYGLKQDMLREYMTQLGTEPSHIKTAMLRRLLWNLIDNAVHNTGLGIIGDCEEVPERAIRYQDFSEAYKWDDGRYYYQLRPEEKDIRELEEVIESYGQSGVGFVNYARTPTPPFCQQKMMRYQKVALYRIRGKWTDPTAHPPGGIGRSDYETMFQTYIDAINRWYEDLQLPRSPKRPEVYEKVFGLLGEATECKRAVVDCLTFRSQPAKDLQEAAFQWLKEHTVRAVKD